MPALGFNLQSVPFFFFIYSDNFFSTILTSEITYLDGLASDLLGVL